MVDYQELMAMLSIPRPNGSHALRDTNRSLKRWLADRGIPFRSHKFRLYPYFFEAIGLWLIISRTLLAASIWFRWGWVSFAIATLGMLGASLDYFLNLPVITWPGAQEGENILLEFSPAKPEQELIFSAHYDSKSELLDHRQRMIFLKSLPLGILLTLLLGLLGPFECILSSSGSPWGSVVYLIGIVATLPLLMIAWGLGINLLSCRFAPPSPGAVDNGAACAILLGLAEKLARGGVHLVNTKVTLALFCGEEVNMQGSRAYVSERNRDLPAIALNMEAMAQNGAYVYWERDGTIFRLLPTTESLNQAISKVVYQITGNSACAAGPIISDGGSFLVRGIPATTFGTYHSRLIDTGFHQPADNIERVVYERLSEGVEILSQVLVAYDQETRSNLTPNSLDQFQSIATNSIQVK